MDTLTIRVENPSVLASLKKVLGVMEGVVILSQNKSESHSRSIPNAVTKRAIQDVKEGKTYSTKSVDDLFKACSINSTHF